MKRPKMLTGPSAWTKSPLTNGMHAALLIEDDLINVNFQKFQHEFLSKMRNMHMDNTQTHHFLGGKGEEMYNESTKPAIDRIAPETALLVNLSREAGRGEHLLEENQELSHHNQRLKAELDDLKDHHANFVDQANSELNFARQLLNDVRSERDKLATKYENLKKKHAPKKEKKATKKTK